MSATWNGSKWIRPAKRLAIYIRDEFRCLSCNRDLRDAAPVEINLDHLIPRSEGGTNDASNLVTACKRCNSARGAKRWTKFYPVENHASVRRTIRRKLNVNLAKALILGETN